MRFARVTAATASASLAGAPLWSMTAAEAADALLLLTRARSQLDELLMRVLRHAEAVEVGTDLGATTANWWAHTSRLPRAEAHRTARLAEAMERHHAVAAALAAGDVHTDQARVIVDAVDDLPADIESWVAPAATAFLLEKATRARRQGPPDPRPARARGDRPRGRRRRGSTSSGGGGDRRPRCGVPDAGRRRPRPRPRPVQHPHPARRDAPQAPARHGVRLVGHGGRGMRRRGARHRRTGEPISSPAGCSPGTGWGWPSWTTSRHAPRTPSPRPAGCRRPWS